MAPGRHPLPEDATTQTLNYALGNLGGRQKSWMTLPYNAPALPPVPVVPPSTVRGRGRPRKHPAPAPASNTSPQNPNTTPQIPSQPRPTVETERQPPSNSTSPRLPNVLVPQNTATSGPSVAHVFPSPTPSEETSAYPPPHESASSKRPSEGQEQQAEKRRRSQVYAQGRPLSIANTTNACPDLPHRPSGQLDSRSPSFGIMASLQTHQGTQLHNQQPSRTQLQPYGPLMPPPMTWQAPNSRPLSCTTQPEYGPIAPSAHNPSNNGWYTKNDCLQRLSDFQTSIPPLLGHTPDAKRLLVMREAIMDEDWSYVSMHQSYCMLTHARHMILQSVLELPGLHEAQNILKEVLDSNHNLAPNCINFFINFPYPIEQIASQWPAKFVHQTQRFGHFVAQSQNYRQVKAVWLTLRRPPLARDLAVQLGIASPTFQRLLFTAVLRCSWRGVLSNPTYTSFEAQALAIFRQNQDDCHQRSPVESLEFLRAREDQWVTKLRTLTDAFEAALQQQGLSLAEIRNRVSQQQQQLPVAPQYHPQQIQSNYSIADTNAMPPRPNSSVDQRSAQAAIKQSRGLGRLPARPTRLAAISPAAVPPPSRPERPLLPVLNFQPPQQREPNPTRYALHQAHLRSPDLQSQSKSSPLYIFLSRFLKPPARLCAPAGTIEKWTFTLSPSDMQKIATTVQDTTGGPGAMNINEGNEFVHLRCVEWPQSSPMVTLTDDLWAVADTHWIPHSYYTFNGTPLDPRKKLHYGKDLPIDLTGLLKEGENVLEFVVMAPSGDTSHLSYLIAIEGMDVLSHESIKQQCLNQSCVAADQVLQSIKKKLAGVDDDEITVVQSTLTIGLFDPFSQTKMCDIPVRSKACPHNDCFDLDTFLQSRPRKGDASVADHWKCPICRSDARPQMLIVDGFIEDVKKQLELQGLASTRYILVQQDGSWQPKAEVRQGVSDDTPEPVTERSVPADADVIDLSD